MKYEVNEQGHLVVLLPYIKWTTSYRVTPFGIQSPVTKKLLTTTSTGSVRICVNGKRVEINRQQLAALTNKSILKQEEKRMNENYIVGSITNGEYSFSRKPAKHSNLRSAELEAERLAKSNPGKKFIVARLVSAFETQSVVKTTSF